MHCREWFDLCEDSAVRGLLVGLGQTHASADLRRTIAELDRQLRQKVRNRTERL